MSYSQPAPSGIVRVRFVCPRRPLWFRRMRKTDLAIRLARDGRVTAAQAADQLDRAVHDILKAVRSGKSANLPGLGRFLPGVGDTITFEKTPVKPIDPKRD